MSSSIAISVDRRGSWLKGLLLVAAVGLLPAGAVGVSLALRSFWLTEQQKSLEEIEAQLEKTQREIAATNEEGLKVDSELKALKEKNEAKLEEAKRLSVLASQLREEIKFLDDLQYVLKKETEIALGKIFALEADARDKVSAAETELAESKDTLEQITKLLQHTQNMRKNNEFKQKQAAEAYAEAVGLRDNIASALTQLDSDYRNAVKAKKNLDTACTALQTRYNNLSKREKSLQAEYQQKLDENNELRERLGMPKRNADESKKALRYIPGAIVCFPSP